MQQKIKSAGVHWNLGEAKATEEYSALYSGKCKRCGQRKEVTNVSGTWTNAISDQEYPDGNIPSPTCLDCYYDIYGEPDGDPDIGIMESKANEDDHKKSWDKLDSIAKQGFSDIGYDQQSWDSDPEEVRAEMETVVKDNMSQENWKDVANKIYKEELNKGKKSGGEAKLKAGYAQCPHCSTQMNRLDWLQDHIKTSHPTKANEEDPCWKGYKQIGMKDKNGKQVPNCVPESKSTEESWGKDFYNSLKDEYGYHNWNDNNQLSSAHDQIKLMKDYGIADKTLRQMGYDLKKDGMEGFIDRIEKELSKFGINLDKPEEQEE